MTTPIIESIAVDLESAVNAITTGNGFNQTLVAVRPKRILFVSDTWDDLNVLIVQAEESERDGTSNSLDKVQLFSLQAIVIGSDNAAASIDTRINQVAADIEKKLRVDPERSTNAIDTTIISVEPMDNNEAFSGVEIIVEVLYRVDYDDPYTKA